jgi:hypothetical protein
MQIRPITGAIVVLTLFGLATFVLWKNQLVFFRTDVEALMSPLSVSEARLSGYTASRFLGEDLSEEFLNDTDKFVINGVSIAHDSESIDVSAHSTIVMASPISAERLTKLEEYLEKWSGSRLGSSISDVEVHRDSDDSNNLLIVLKIPRDWVRFSHLPSFRKSYLTRTKAEPPR